MRDSKLRWLANDGVIQMTWNLVGAVGGVEAFGSIYCWLMMFCCNIPLLSSLSYLSYLSRSHLLILSLF